jgi:hypothetical protein
MDDTSGPFWRGKRLDELTPAQWEALCDGCGRCCLLKLEDEDTGEIHKTRLACRLLDIGSCRCADYPRRHELVADCVRIDAGNVPQLTWMPDTCAYRLVAEGRDLYWWHPLISGDGETVHQAGVSVRGFALSEAKVKRESFEDYIIEDASPPKRAQARSGKARRPRPSIPG